MVMLTVGTDSSAARSWSTEAEPSSVADTPSSSTGVRAKSAKRSTLHSQEVKNT